MSENRIDKMQDALAPGGGIRVPLLLEIGTEEIPARFLPQAVSDLKNIAASLLEEYRIECREMRSYATPRRLVLMVSGIDPMQKDVTKEVFGPSKKAAFDENGQPTKAAVGFAASVGVEASALMVRTKGKGEYVVAVKEEKGLETKAVMPEVLKKIITALRFPKAMRWADGTFSFVRPIHWLVALLGFEAVDIEIDGIKSGNMTRGHRFLSPADFQIRDIASYMHLLETNYVILDQDRRKTLIRNGIETLAEGVKGRPVMDDELLETVNFLVEFPTAVLCGFSEEYLELPDELLITVMKDHQKYFAIRNSQSSLLNRFVMISNTRPDNSQTVRTGAERVIRARFDDAKFYFTEDRKKPLSTRVDDLKKVTFHDELGTLFEKTTRICGIAAFVAKKVNTEISESRAALLSKADLTTGVVREFPELQGIMGKYYAICDNEEKITAQAIEEQYLPKFFGDRLPETVVGAILSLSDKADNVASFFSIGLVPTGSEDPFALRRQAMGIVSILLDKGYEITVKELFETALEYVPMKEAGAGVMEQIMAFMEQRVEFVLSSTGCDRDIVQSVLSLSRSYPLKTIASRIEAIKEFKKTAGYQDFLLAVKRVNNIIPKGSPEPVNEALFIQDEEKELFASLLAVRGNMVPLQKVENFLAALEIFSGITTPINVFFDKVLVMDKKPEVKNNRLALLKEVWTTASFFADFSKLS